MTLKKDDKKTKDLGANGSQTFPPQMRQFSLQF